MKEFAIDYIQIMMFARGQSETHHAQSRRPATEMIYSVDTCMLYAKIYAKI